MHVRVSYVMQCMYVMHASFCYHAQVMMSMLKDVHAVHMHSIYIDIFCILLGFFFHTSFINEADQWNLKEFLTDSFAAR
jgi:hypothetical protein